SAKVAVPSSTNWRSTSANTSGTLIPSSYKPAATKMLVWRSSTRFSSCIGRKETAAVDTTMPHTKQMTKAAIKVPLTLSLLKAIMLHLQLRYGADGDGYSLESRSSRSGAHTSYRTRWPTSCLRGTLGWPHESQSP